MIATLSELKTYLEIGDTSQDVLLQMLLDSAQSSVESFTWRKFEADSVDQTEIFNGNAQKELFLQKYPIISLTSVDYNAGDTNIAEWQEVANTGYSIESKIWTINFLSEICRWYQKYRVIYKWGYEIMPADLKIAVLKIASANFNRRTSDGIKWETVNGDRIDFELSEIPGDVVSILNNYRRPYV